jgi:D-3-phosphoglycerate dehydrogenase / 2-oxoglutarate reductase
MAIKILVTGRIPQEALDYLKKHFEVSVDPKTLSEAVGLLIRTETFVSEELLKSAPKLRIVVRAGVGLDNVDLKACAARGIEVQNTPGANSVSAAEHTLGLILSVARMMPQANARLKAGGWDRDNFTGVEIKGKTLGIIGYGNVGSKVSKLAQAFGMKVIGNDILPKNEIPMTTKSELLKQSDFVTLHVPLTDETKAMANSEFFSEMKKGSFFINASRGAVVVEQDLLKALDLDHLRGAALDVFVHEPIEKGSLLLKSEKVILTPHTAGQTTESQKNMGLEAAHIMKEFLCPE